MLTAGFVTVWGVGIQGLSLTQLKADLASWAKGGPTLPAKGVYA